MNSKQPNLSRRDWFRLKPAAPSPTADSSTGNSVGINAGTKRVPNPINHAEMDLSELPPMREAQLNADQLQLLCTDLSAHATDINLRGIQTTSQTRNDKSILLKHACEQLNTGAVQRLQIRYNWSGYHWIDTLEAADSGYRLIRIRHQQ